MVGEDGRGHQEMTKFFAEMVHCGAGFVATRAKTGHMGLFRKLGGGEKLKIPGAEKLC